MSDPFPISELPVIDATIRAFTEPCLRADIPMLIKIWQNERDHKRDLMAEIGVTADQLQSADRFADLLRAEGVEPGLKPSPKNPDKSIYAFAKSDQFMLDLLDDVDDRVRGLAEARLGVKSTITQTRAESLARAASRGPVPVYYKYCGAHTLRDSGGDALNFTNFKRKGSLRKSIMAPEKYLLGIVDMAQVECRMLAWLADEKTLLNKFRNGQDPYIGIASMAYNEVIYKPAKDDPRKAEMEMKRGSGKLLELSCQYQSGWRTIQRTAKAGTYGPPVEIDEDTARRWKKLYDQTHPAIAAPHTGYWAQAGRMIARLAGGPPIQWGPIEIRDKRIYGPDGTFMIYNQLEWHVPTAEECQKLVEFKHSGYWRWLTRSGWRELSPGVLTQNICEFLCRALLKAGMLEIIKAGYRVPMRTYDEVVVLIPRDGHEEEHLQFCIEAMRRAPAWAPELPLDAEGHLSERYSK